MIEPIKIYSPSGQVILEGVDDKSYRVRSIMSQHNVTVFVSKADALKISLGSYLDFQGIRYTLESPKSIKKVNNSNIEYTIIFESPESKLAKYKVRNTVDKRLKFPYPAKPKEHLQLIVDNLNLRDSGWSIGDCIDAVEAEIYYNHTFCSDAVKMITDTFKTELEVKNKTFYLRKIEYNKNNPLALAYGKGNGFKTGITRTNVDSSKAVEVIFTQGGERNIDYSKYKSKELLLPKNQTIGFDGVFFEDQKGFNPKNARYYKTDQEGYSISRADKGLKTHEEDSLDCSNIYPSRVGTITDFKVDDQGNYDIYDSTIPNNLDFSKYRIEGEKMTVIFQDKMLVSREFDVMQTDKKVSGYIHDQRKFMLVSQEYDGQKMPNEKFTPEIGGKYAVFGMMLPDEYICDNSSKSGASWDMLREGIKYFFENEESKFSFTGELDGIWAKRDWLNIGGKIILGGYVSFTDNQMIDEEDNQNNSVLIRISSIKDYLNDPYTPEITLANVTAATYASDFRKIEENEVIAETLNKNTRNFAKRGWRDAKETIDAVKGLFDDFENSEISAEAFRGMVGLFGSENLQYQFLNSNWITAISPTIYFDPQTKQVTCEETHIQHMTLGINSVQPNKAVSEYKFWTVSKFTSAVLAESNVPYFLYIKASKSSQLVNGRNIGKATFFISPSKIKLDDLEGFYTFWVGYFNSENMEGDRSYRSMYGYTEILPGQITVDKLLSSNGGLVIDLSNNFISAKDGATIQGNIKFESNGNYKNVKDEFEIANDKIDNIQVGDRNLISNLAVNWEQGTVNHTLAKGLTYDDVKVSANNRIRIKELIDVSDICAISWSSVENWTKYNLFYLLFDKDGKYLGQSSGTWQSSKFLIESKVDKIAILVATAENIDLTTKTIELNYLKIKLERGNKYTAWSPAPEDLLTEINFASQKVNDLNLYIDGSFKTGVIETSEANAISKDLNTISVTMAQAEATYDKIFTNKYLDGTVKTTLLNTKVGLAGAKYELEKAIKTSIVDKKITEAERKNINDKFTIFNTNLSAFQKAVEDAYDSLSTKKVENIEIGGRNYVKGSDIYITERDKQFDFASFKELRGKTITVSVDIEVKNATGNRIGFEPSFVFTDGTVQFVGAWHYVTSGSNFKGRISSVVTLPDKEIKEISQRGIYVQCTGTVTKIGRPQLEIGNKATDWKLAPEDIQADINKAMAKAEASTYLQTALKNRTEIDGGLLLTTLLKLGIFSGKDFIEKAGINGSASKPNDVVAWFGGSLQQAIQNLASIVFRMDGSAIFGKGSTAFNSDGSGKVANGNISWDAKGNPIIRGRFESNAKDNRIIIDPSERMISLIDSTNNVLGKWFYFKSPDGSNVGSHIEVSQKRGNDKPMTTTIAGGAIEVSKTSTGGAESTVLDYSSLLMTGMAKGDSLNTVDIRTASTLTSDLVVILKNLPSSSRGLERGQLWRDGKGNLKIVDTL